MDAYKELDHWELGRKYNELVYQLGQIEEEIGQRSVEDRHLITPEQWVWRSPRQTAGMQQKTKDHRNARLVAAELGFNVHNFHAFVVEIPPGGVEGAYHMHGEAIKFYLQGRAKEIIGDKEYEVRAGDVMLVPIHTWHGTQNPFSEPVRFFAVGYTAAGVPIMQQPIFRLRDDLRLKDSDVQKTTNKDYSTMEGWELGRIKHRLLQDLGFLEAEMEDRRVEDRHVMRSHELEWTELAKEIGGDFGKPHRLAKAVFPELGFRAFNFLAFFIEIPPGNSDVLYHMHGEEVKYYLQGSGEEVIGEKKYGVKKGDVIFVPANTWHGTRNLSDEPLRYFAVSAGRGIPVATPATFKVR